MSTRCPVKQYFDECRNNNPSYDRPFGEGVDGVADWDAGGALAAAILGQVGHELTHGAVLGGIDELAAQAPLCDQAGMRELLKMKRQRGRQHPQPLGDDAGGQPPGTVGHQQPEKFEPSFPEEGRRVRVSDPCLPYDRMFQRASKTY